MKGLIASLIELRRNSKRSLASFLEIFGFTFAGVFPSPDSDVLRSFGKMPLMLEL